MAWPHGVRPSLQYQNAKIRAPVHAYKQAHDINNILPDLIFTYGYIFGIYHTNMNICRCIVEYSVMHGMSQCKFETGAVCNVPLRCIHTVFIIIRHKNIIFIPPASVNIFQSKYSETSILPVFG